MPSAVDIRGQVFRDGSATLLARVIGGDGASLIRSDITQVHYTVYLLDHNDPNLREAVEGHEEREVPPAGLLFDAPQLDSLWTVDAIGYNFRHMLDVSANAAFPLAGRTYLVVFKLTPTVGPVILVRFRLTAI
ncbi:MAG: hypothetical protein GXX96_08675 [Planctomycetaceae bacterium]|nr:hypothetical protein [Planctomycetaceae bacterium]